MKAFKIYTILILSMFTASVFATKTGTLTDRRINTVKHYIHAIRDRNSSTLKKIFSKDAKMFVSGEKKNAVAYVSEQFVLQPAKAKVQIVNLYIGQPIRSTIILYAKYKTYDHTTKKYSGKETAFFDLFVFQPNTAIISNVYVLGNKVSSRMLASVMDRE